MAIAVLFFGVAAKNSLMKTHFGRDWWRESKKQAVPIVATEKGHDLTIVVRTQSEPIHGERKGAKGNFNSSSAMQCAQITSCYCYRNGRLIVGE